MELLDYPEHIKPYGDVIIQSNTEVEDEIRLLGLVLHKDTTFEKQRSKRIYGRVVAVPYRLSPKRIHQEDYQHPKGTISFSGDIIRLQAIAYEKMIRRTLQVKEQRRFKDKFTSGPYEPEFTRNNQQEMVAKVGDTAWFHYLSLSNDTYLGQDREHNRYYRVPYESCFCFTGPDGTRAANGYMQVVPYWDNTFEEIEVNGRIIRGKLKGNLVIALKETPEYLTGVIHHKGKCFGNDMRPTLVTGDVIMYDKGSDFTNTINGVEVMVMQQWRVFAKMVDKTFIPVGPWVQLKPKKIPERKIVLVDQFYNEVDGEMESVHELKKTLDEIIEPVAEVLAVGDGCQYVTSSMKNVYFNRSGKVFHLGDTIFVREGDIMMEWDGDYQSKLDFRTKLISL